MLNEISLREAALCEHNISYMLLSKKCGEIRRSTGKFKCNGNCADRFPTGNEGFESVKKLRHSLWISPESLSSECMARSNKGLNIRKSALIKSLVSMTAKKDSGELEINYNIAGVNVCKNFFTVQLDFLKNYLTEQLLSYYIEAITKQIRIPTRSLLKKTYLVIFVGI